MAIYHCSIKIVSRNSGRSSAGAAAYRSGEKLTSERDGQMHDYSRKRGIAYTEIMLPEHAPQEYRDRQTLWSAVEKSCKAGDERTAREIEIALPVELTRREQIKLVQQYVKENFVDSGMCADIAIHSGGHGHPTGKDKTEKHDAIIKQDNPHAHILLTMRPIDKGGKWENKTEKVYLCKNKQGEEKGFSPKEYNSQAGGWEKQYKYKLGNGKAIYLTPSEASRERYQSYTRVSRDPKSMKYGRENPTSEEWNNEKSLLKWRENWAKAINDELKIRNLPGRVSHLSLEAQGKTDQRPTIHLGVAAHTMEKQGAKTEKGERNREIKRHNAAVKILNTEITKAEHQIATLKRQLANYDVKGTARQLENFRNVFKAATVQAQSNHTERKENPIYRHQAVQIDECVKMINQQKATIILLKGQKESLGLFQGQKKKSLQQKITEFERQREEQETKLKSLGVSSAAIRKYADYRDLVIQ